MHLEKHKYLFPQVMLCDAIYSVFGSIFCFIKQPNIYYSDIFMCQFQYMSNCIKPVKNNLNLVWRFDRKEGLSLEIRRVSKVCLLCYQIS